MCIIIPFIPNTSLFLILLASDNPITNQIHTMFSPLQASLLLLLCHIIFSRSAHRRPESSRLPTCKIQFDAFMLCWAKNNLPFKPTHPHTPTSHHHSPTANTHKKEKRNAYTPPLPPTCNTPFTLAEWWKIIAGVKYSFFWPFISVPTKLYASHGFFFAYTKQVTNLNLN